MKIRGKLRHDSCTWNLHTVIQMEIPKMPKATHFHQAHDAMGTDNKATNLDDKILAHDKQEFQQSEANKKKDPQSEQEFVNDQDKKNEE